MKKIMNTLEVFAKAMVQSLMYLSVAGMILAIGSLLTNSTVTGLLPFLAWGPIQVVGKLMYETMMILINNLGLLFVIGIPAALAKRDKHQAALIGFMSYLIYLKTSNIMLTTMGLLAEPSAMLGLFGTGQATILGIQVVDMSVFGGILLGCLVGWVFNKTCEKKFSGAFQIYSGVRFSFACMVAASIIFGAVTNVVWPAVQGVISAMANFIKSTDVFGLFIYGFLERLLIPTGLHHLVYTPFQFTDLGGVLNLGKTVIAGAYPIVMTELQMGLPFSDSIYYMAIGFTKMFGYIGIGAAFIHTAHSHNKKRTAATIIPLIVTACLASITEPLDFMFIFVAPVLYVLHACIAGLFIALLKICGGNMLASILMNLSAGVERTQWPIMLALGVVQILVYFFLFSFLIKKFNYKTPGREDDLSETKEDKTPAKAFNGSEDAKYVVEGLGGKDNINTVENCFTRLRPKARIINICDMPIAIIDVVAAALEIKDKENIVYDYYGLNHFGWFTSVEYKGEDMMPKLREYIMEHEILLPAAYLKDKAALAGKKTNRHTKGSWYYVWKGVYEIMANFPDTLPNTYLNYYLQQKEFVEHSDPTHTRTNEVMESREKNLFDGIDEYLKTGEVKETVFYAGSHGDWIADLAIALKNDTKARFLVITENRGCIPNLPYDAMVEVPAYIGKNGPDVLAQDPIPLFQQGLIMQQLNSEKLIVQAAIEGSYRKALEAFTLSKTVPSMNVAKAVLDDMIEANKGYLPELK